MSEADTAWLSGLFDGEGGISINYNKRCNSYGGCVTLSNNIWPVLEEAARVIAELGAPPGRVSVSGRCNVLNWGSLQGTLLLRKLLPYLRNPRQQSRGVLYCKFWVPERYRRPDRQLRDELYEKWPELKSKWDVF